MPLATLSNATWRATLFILTQDDIDYPELRTITMLKEALSNANDRLDPALSEQRHGHLEKHQLRHTAELFDLT